MRISRWSTSPETRPLRDPANPTQFLGVDTVNGIRVFAHELGHKRSQLRPLKPGDIVYLG